MRLSATDRIIREAEQHESAAVEAVEHPDTEKVSAGPLLSLGIAPPRMPTPLNGGVDVSFDDDDDGHDDEGETQVDAQRSAAALDQMRALQEGALTPPPILTSNFGGERPRGLPPGRPGGTATMGLAMSPARSADAPPVPTLTFGSAPAPALRPTAPPSLAHPPPPALAPDDNRPEHLFSSSRLQFGALPIPAPQRVPARRHFGVGRRTGLVITASTALAVALIVGAWTTRDAEPVRAAIARPAPAPTLAARAAVLASTTPGSAAVVAPEAAPPSPPPELVPWPAPPDPAVAVPSPSTAEVEEVPPATATMPPPTEAAKAQPKTAKAGKVTRTAIKARATRKKVVTSSRRTAHVAPKATRATGRSAPAAPAGQRGGRADPDDTLPITD